MQILDGYDNELDIEFKKINIKCKETTATDHAKLKDIGWEYEDETYRLEI